MGKLLFMQNKFIVNLVEAHKYLYYVLNRPVLSDYEYDKLCKDNGLDGKGGSDLDTSYSIEVKQLANKLLKNI